MKKNVSKFTLKVMWTVRYLHCNVGNENGNYVHTRLKIYKGILD